MPVGIEAINAYVGRLSIPVRAMFADRGLALDRFENLMMDVKSVNLPCEDAITNAVNAAKPLIDTLPGPQRERIELLIVGTESGIDFGKPLSTYVHEYLGLPARCRSFEVKHACYGGTAALQSAAAIIAASPVPGARALVIAADAPSKAARGSYWEPSEGAGAVAMLIGHDPRVLEIDPGASGFHTYEVMDTARPSIDADLVDSDLSLLAYLSCAQGCFEHYRERVRGADILATFDYLAFHTPFAGMVKGAHRALLRGQVRLRPDQVEEDFTRRVVPSLAYPRQVGNLFSAALYLALCSLIENGDFPVARRIGLFSYGSGCASEFYSGVVSPHARAATGGGPGWPVARALAERQVISVAEHDALNDPDRRAFGVRDAVFDPGDYEPFFGKLFAGHRLLVLDRIANYHREYRWT
jgi:polyketide biosynthesis 3-hydroxy-3-methylglutaryl-CoA synthase-like enzyme PksG